MWAERLGSLVRVPEDIRTELTGLPVEYAEEVLNPSRTPWLSRTTVLRPGKDGDLVPEDPSAMPSGHGLMNAVDGLASLAYGLPHGHPLRAALPAGLAAVRRLADRSRADTRPRRRADGEGRPDRGRAAQGVRAARDRRRRRARTDPGGRGDRAAPWYQDVETVLIR